MPDLPSDLPPFVTVRDLAIVLRLLNDVVEGGAGAYARVANRIGKDRPYLNERIERVESQLNVRLLERGDNGRRVCRLTRAGTIYLSLIVVMLADWEVAATEMRRVSENGRREKVRKARRPRRFVGRNRTAGRHPGGAPPG
jgi:DNA-binding transcriptional LysR family regulator